MQDIFVEDIGTGIPLVLVHGFLGSSDMWGPQIDFFKNDFRVIAPALPGFGKSNKVRSCDSIEGMAKAILNSLEKKKIKSFNLLGINYPRLSYFILRDFFMISVKAVAEIILLLGLKKFGIFANSIN